MASPEIAELAKIGVVASLPALAVVQAVKAALHRRLEPKIGQWRWNVGLRALSGGGGLAAGLALGGGAWAAFAGAGGGLAATVIFATILRAIRSWQPPARKP